MDDAKRRRYADLKDRWDKIVPGLTLQQAEQIMGFRFKLDSERISGRLVYSHHTADYLPFYLVIDRETRFIVRRHDIRALNEVANSWRP